MTTARDIIKKSMQRLGILTKGEEPADDEANDALSSLNMMLESWSTDSLSVYALTWETFTVTGGQASYTIGSGGDFNTVKPISIKASYITIGDTDYTLQLINDADYNRNILQKQITGIPDYITFDNAYPLSTIRLYPVPSTNYDLFLLTEKPLVILALDDIISLPVGWERALVNNLAIELAPEYGQQVTGDLRALAKNSKRAIERAVSKNRPFDYPRGGTNRNIYTGWGL